MTTPMDPNNLNNLGNSEFSWGPGLFPPGIANNEGQTKQQDDFGANMKPAVNADGATLFDNYARAVADRRTDPCDPESNRDFETLGNVDRFGANPALVQADPQPNVPDIIDIVQNKTPRAK